MKIVVGNDSPKDVHTLIHGTCDCVVLHGKWNFADVTNGMDLQMKKKHPGIPRWAQSHHMSS